MTIAFKMSRNSTKLYEICINVLVKDCLSVCKFRKKEFRVLPNNVLLDFYYKFYCEKRLCLLAVEFSDLEIFSRMVLVKHQSTKLLKIYQSLIDHGSDVLESLVLSYSKHLKNQDVTLNDIDTGLRIGGFLNEGAWYSFSIRILNITEELCKRKEKDVTILRKLLDCYHKKIYAEAIYCDFKAAEKTFKSAEEVINELKTLDSLPNLAGLYSNISTLYFIKSEYDKAFSWSSKALLLLTEKLPIRVKIEVLRQASKACVVKRRFTQAGLLIQQAMGLASNLYKYDNHPHYSDTLIDYGFYLLNYDSVPESVQVYQKSLAIRKEVFEKNNIHVALGLDDLAYALYVHEYSSGRFYSAKENVDRSIKIMERILPKDHLMLASAKRVKALILEEISLDMRDNQYPKTKIQFLEEAEQLHNSALFLSFEAFGEKNVQTAKHYGNLGRLYQSMKLYEKAEKMHLKAIAIKEELLGDQDYEVGLSLGHLASLYNYHMKRHLDAEKLYLRSIEINLNLFGESYSGLEYDYRGLINVYTHLADLNNVVRYNAKMREWKKLREVIKPIVHNEEVIPMKTLVDKFFEMC